MKRLCLLVALMMMPVFANDISARRFSISTNLLDYARLGTLNLEASYAASRYWSVTASARCNPFTFYKGDSERQFQYRQQSYAVGARWWLWHAWSGWWFSGKARYQEYNVGGIGTRDTEEGDIHTLR